MTIDFDTLYSIRPSLGDSIFTADFELDLDSLGATVRGDIPADKPLHAHWIEGNSEPGALIGSVGLSTLVVSEPLFQSLSGLSGFSSVPVFLEGKQGQKVGNYFLIIVHGRCGPIDPTRSQLITGNPKDEPILKGLYFSDEDWDKSDLFMTHEKTYFVFGTEKILKKFIELAPNEVAFTPLAQMEQHPLGLASIIDHQKRQGINKHDWRWSG